MPIQRYMKWCVWSGPVYGTLFFVALLLMNFMPPPANLSGEEYMAILANINLARLGVILMIFAAILSMPFNTLIAILLAKIEGRIPLMAVMSFGGGVVNTMAFAGTAVFFMPVIYRVDRAPELIQLMIDLDWLMTVSLFVGFALQCVAVAIVAFHDKSQNPILPRWLGYFMLWFALLTAPGVLAFYFKVGPFAWNGIIAFWVPAIAFGVYFGVLIPTLFKGIKVICGDSDSGAAEWPVANQAQLKNK